MSEVRNGDAPTGGLVASPRSRRAWKWIGDDVAQTVPVRCKREEWYCLRATPAAPPAGEVTCRLNFARDDELLASRHVVLAPLTPAAGDGERVAWVQSPPDATHVQLCLDPAIHEAPLAHIDLHPTAERDPKCHPLANVPRWGAYTPPLPLTRVVLPRRLAALAEQITHAEVELSAAPKSLRGLKQKAQGAALILEPAWVAALQMTLADLESLAAESWVICDLATLAELTGAADVATTRIETYSAVHELMSARVEYADVATRGFAMQDVFPLAWLSPEGFTLRVLKATRSWQRYADQVGFATLLASETPYEKKCGDVITAALPTSGGELIASDVPWLVAAPDGPPAAPQLLDHLLRMLLGAPLGDHLQYWNRWEDAAVLVRDIADLPRRFPALRAVRWAAPEDTIAHLGLALTQPISEPARDQVVFCTGRTDQAGAHDGVPAEALIIFIKHLAREQREQTEWARRYLAGRQVVWQFDTAEGLRHVVDYPSAAGTADQLPTIAAKVRTAVRHGGDRRRPPLDYAADITLPSSAGLFGDRSFVYQDQLSRALCRVIEELPRPPR